MGNELPEGWDNYKLGDIAKYINGRAFKPSEWEKEGLPIIRIQNLKDPDKRYNYFSGEYEQKHEVNDGDILFSWSGTIGTSFGTFKWKGGKAILNQHIFRVEVRKDIVTPDFFVYLLNHSINKINEEAHGGVGLGHITKAKLVKIEVPIPPLPIQEALVKKLDAFFKEYDLLKEEKQKAQELHASIYPSALFKLLEKFGETETIKIGELFEQGLIKEIKSGFPSGKHSRKGDLIHIRPMNINIKGMLDLSSCKYVEPDDDKVETYKLQKGDVVFNNTNSPELVGKTMYFNSDENCVFSNHMTRIKVNKEMINPEYLAIYLHSLWRQGFFKIICRSHVSQASVNNSMLKEVEIHLPSIKDQNLIVSKLEAINKPMKILNEESKGLMVNLELLPHSVLTKAFQGELIA